MRQLYLFFLFLPLLPLREESLDPKSMERISKEVFGLSPVHTYSHTVKVRPENKNFLPFVDQLSLAARYADRLEYFPKVFKGPFTGHLADNLLFGAVLHTSGHPVSLSSFLVVVATRSTTALSPYSWFIEIGRGLGISNLSAISLPCKRRYGVDILFYGNSPGQGRVYHRSIILFAKGIQWPLFTTGGFGLGPMGSFSYGPGYAYVGDPGIKVSTFLYHNCTVTWDSLILRKGAFPLHSVLTVDLSTNKVIPPSGPTPMKALQKILSILEGVRIPLRLYTPLLHKVVNVWEALVVSLALDISIEDLHTRKAFFAGALRVLE